MDEALLARLGEWRTAGPGPHALSAPLSAGGWSLNATAEAAESVGCRLTELRLTRPAGEPASAAALTQWAVRTAKRVTGLLEPLKLIEVDAGRGEALLRSESPAARVDSVEYYELRLTGDHDARLRRYRASRTAGGREAVPFALTHEAVAKLAGDLTAE
jgi:hypothetical protein